MLIGTWVPSFVFPEERCFASLVWFIEKYGFLAFVMLSTVGGLMVMTAMVIFYRLSTVSYIEQNHRIAASRMVYYLALGIVSLVRLIVIVPCCSADISRFSWFLSSDLYWQIMDKTGILSLR